MPRLAAYGLTSLAFLAGFVLAGTLAFTFRSVEAVAEPTLEPTPVALGPCSAEMEHAYEIVRFAQYSHIPWRDMALRDEVTEEGWDANGQAGPDLLFQQWWIDNYDDAMAAIEAECVPDPEHPNLTDLPAPWESYPPRDPDGR